MQLDTYPVGFPIPPAACYFTSKTGQEKTRQKEGQQGCLTPVNAPSTDVIKTGPHAITVLEKSVEACQGKLQTSLMLLGEQNKQLQLALIDQTSCSKKMALLYDTQAKILEDRALFLQQQMQQLTKTHEENTKRLENLLSIAQNEQTTALDLAKQTWNQEKTGLIREHQALQAQQSSLIGTREALQGQRSTLQKQVNEATERQQAAIQAKIASVKEYFLHVLDVEIEIASDPKRLAYNTSVGRTADGKGALIFLKNHLENVV